jgi:hypothetical protein
MKASYDTNQAELMAALPDSIQAALRSEHSITFKRKIDNSNKLKNVTNTVNKRKAKNKVAKQSRKKNRR